MKKLIKSVIFLLTIVMPLTSCSDSGNTRNTLHDPYVEQLYASQSEAYFSVERPPNDMGKLTEFSYRFGSFFGGEWHYHIFAEDGKLYIEAKGYNGAGPNKNGEVPDNTLDVIADIIKEYDIQKWNGFDERDNGCMDCYGFTIKGEYENGTLAASGYAVYPSDYEAGHKALDGYLGVLASSIDN